MRLHRVELVPELRDRECCFVLVFTAVLYWTASGPFLTLLGFFFVRESG